MGPKYPTEQRRPYDTMNTAIDHLERHRFMAVETAQEAIDLGMLFGRVLFLAEMYEDYGIPEVNEDMVTWEVPEMLIDDSSEYMTHYNTLVVDLDAFSEYEIYMSEARRLIVSATSLHRNVIVFGDYRYSAGMAPYLVMTLKFADLLNNRIEEVIKLDRYPLDIYTQEPGENGDGDSEAVLIWIYEQKDLELPEDIPSTPQSVIKAWNELIPYLQNLSLGLERFLPAIGAPISHYTL